MSHISAEREELIRRLRSQGMSIWQIKRTTGHAWETVNRVLKGRQRTIKRVCTRTIKCPGCGRLHKHTIQAHFYKGTDLLDE